jgi:L-fucose dehydrogenase
MNLNLEGKVAIVTGATSGIGEGIALAFAREGAVPVIIGRDAERGAEVAKKVQELSPKSIFVQAELVDPAVCQQVVEYVIQKLGSIDILVNNAGGNDSISLKDGSPEEFVQSLKANLVHYFSMAHYALHHLIKTKGNIVNIGSKVANLGQGGTSGYAAAKGGIQGLTREWAFDLLQYGIRVNEVIPAEVWTSSYEKWMNRSADPAARLKELVDKIPLGKRFTTVDEIADTVVFVASPLSAHTTGQHLFVDGGYTHLDRNA